MKRFLLTSLVGLMLSGCAAVVKDDLDRTDYQFLRYDSIKRIGQELVAERGVNPGDVVLLVPLEYQKGDQPDFIYDDALISGLLKSGVRVVRMSEKQFFYMSWADMAGKGQPAKPDAGGMMGMMGAMAMPGMPGMGAPAPQGMPMPMPAGPDLKDRSEANLYADEAYLVKSLAKLREVGITKVVCYRWMFSNPKGSGASDAKYEYTLTYPADRAFIKVVDPSNGQITWANLLTARR